MAQHARVRMPAIAEHVNAEAPAQENVSQPQPQPSAPPLAAPGVQYEQTQPPPPQMLQPPPQPMLQPQLRPEQQQISKSGGSLEVLI